VSLRLRHLRIRIQTPDGMFGADLKFAEGLYVLQAENSHGKSTCMQAILYALGLEGMLGPSQEVPLPHVAKQYVSHEGKDIPVLASEVMLEIANDSLEFLTVHRQIVGEADRHLVTVLEGPALTEPADYRRQSFFVRQPGAATREAGFHVRLARFLNWDLPTVPTYDEGSVKLYMEAIFPLLFVEQKHGWSSLRGRFPTHFRIRDVNKRAVEFLLDLDAFAIASAKIILQQRANDLKQRWRAKVAEVGRVAQGINAFLDRCSAGAR
jgi:hypothetical protein